MSKQAITAPYIKLTESDHDTNLDLAPDDESPVSKNLKDITLYGSKLAVLVAFDASSLSDISLKTHFIPLAKELKVKHRSMSKYEIVLPLAKALFEQKYLVGNNGQCNYLHLTRNSIKVLKKPNCCNMPSAKQNNMRADVPEKASVDGNASSCTSSDEEENPFEL